ncbi:unnamed protein product [Gadus morhua 'NCC']
MSSTDINSVKAQLDRLWKQREELISIYNKWADQYKVTTRSESNTLQPKPTSD